MLHWYGHNTFSSYFFPGSILADEFSIFCGSVWTGRVSRKSGHWNEWKRRRRESIFIRTDCSLVLLLSFAVCALRAASCKCRFAARAVRSWIPFLMFSRIRRILLSFPARFPKLPAAQNHVIIPKDSVRSKRLIVKIEHA